MVSYRVARDVRVGHRHRPTGGHRTQVAAAMRTSGAGNVVFVLYHSPPLRRAYLRHSRSLALPIVLVIHPDVFAIGLRQSAFLALNGMLTVVAILLYFYALHEDEASFVVPFYQTIPVFAFLLGYFILGETLSLSQIGSAALI